MTEIELLIKQAEVVKVRYKKPALKLPKPSNRTWQEILDNKPYPHLRYGKL